MDLKSTKKTQNITALGFLLLRVPNECQITRHAVSWLFKSYLLAVEHVNRWAPSCNLLAFLNSVISP